MLHVDKYCTNKSCNASKGLFSISPCCRNSKLFLVAQSLSSPKLFKIPLHSLHLPFPLLLLLPLLSFSPLQEAPGELLPDPGHGRRRCLPVLRGEARRRGGVDLQGGQGGHHRLQQQQQQPAPLTHKLPSASAEKSTQPRLVIASDLPLLLLMFSWMDAACAFV